jgi:hypothetical protein
MKPPIVYCLSHDIKMATRTSIVLAVCILAFASEAADPVPVVLWHGMGRHTFYCNNSALLLQFSRGFSFILHRMVETNVWFALNKITK